jgi:hypothetical protein
MADETSKTVTGGSAGGVYPLVVFTAPQVGGAGYAVTGEVRYEDVEGEAYLEMWNVFADGSRYFSRTLAADGARGLLSGSSEWRAFELPFNLGGSQPPVRLEINAVLPGAGTVSIRNLRVVGLDTLTRAGWWSDRTAGFVGGIGGSVIGIFGAFIGWLVSRRRARRFTLAAMTFAAVVGAILTVAGIAAWAMSQSYGTWFPMLVMGVILMLVFGVNRGKAERAYADAEMQRMKALDR